MKKIVVVSDTHGNYRNFSAALKQHKDSDCIIHAGDGKSDIQDLEMYEKALFKKLVFVGGNCDIHGIHERVKIVEIDGIRIFVAHGDRFEVKTDKTVIAKAAKEEIARRRSSAIHTYDIVIQSMVFFFSIQEAVTYREITLPRLMR